MSNELRKCPQCGAPLPANAPAGLCPSCLMALNLQTETVFTDEASAAKPSLSPEELAPHFPQLEILECLGRGGMGVVYKARQKSLNRLVALKLLAPERVREIKFAERFAREAQALAALNHPNIVTIHDFGQAGGFYFLLMEFVDGMNLRQLLRARKFTPEEALAIVPPLCDALQFAHDRGIVHRDIKPENLLLDKSGRIKVADFGIAKMLGGADGSNATGEAGAAINATQTTLGTPGYRAPEQKSSPERVDSRADIYSLGVVFYEMLTGELPGKLIEPPSRKVRIDVRLDEVVLRALEQKPELRFQQVSEVKTMVETIATTTAGAGGRTFAGAAQPPAPPNDIWQQLRKRIWPPVVIRRQGQRVINWPAVAFSFVKALGIGVVFGLAFGIGIGANFGVGAGLLAGFGFLWLLCGLAGLKVTVRILRGYSNPLDELPEFGGTGKPGQPPVNSPPSGAPSNPMRWGVDYRSQTTLFGWPLLHVASGPDLATGRPRVARGIIAIGDFAQGFVAIGGMAMGVFSFGGLAVGCFAYGGGALGLVTFGGLAIGLLAAFGGLAIAPIAMGGGAVGYLAHGGKGIGVYVLDAMTHDPVAQSFFMPWSQTVLENFPLINAVMLALLIGVGVGIPMGLRQWKKPQDKTPPSPPAPSVSGKPSPFPDPSAPAMSPGKSGGNAWFNSPFSSNEARDIAAHMTKAERGEFVLFGLLWGVWVVGATFGNLYILNSFPAPGNWIVAAIIASIFIASLPQMMRMQRRLLGSTGWAKEKGYNAEQMRLFSFSRRNIRLALIFACVAGLLVYGQSQLFTRLSGLSELSQNLKASAAHTAQAEQPAMGKTTVRSLTSAPFIAQLDRCTVELVAISHPPLTDTACWLANGEFCKEAFPAKEGSSDNEDIDADLKIFAFHIRNQSSNKPSMPVFRVDKKSNLALEGSTFGPLNLASSEQVFFQDVRCPSQAKKCKFVFGVANGPWKTAIAESHRPRGMNAGNATESEKEGQWTIGYNAVSTRNGDMAVSCYYTKRPDYETRIVCENRNGKVTVIPDNPSNLPASQSTALLLVSAEEFDDICEFRVERRPYLWVEFRNVSLEPKFRTAVEVKEMTGSILSNASRFPFVFGPIIERTLPLSELGYSYALNLDEDVAEPLPPSLTKTDWSSGIRLPDGIIVVGSATNQTLTIAGTDTRIVPHLPNSRAWEETEPSELSLPYQGKEKQTVSVTLQSAKLPVTVDFRTRKGACGLLQIMSFTENPRGIKIRYKRQQNNSITNSFVAVPSNSGALHGAENEKLEREWASVESWSPTLAAGEKPDLQKLLEDIKTFMDQTHYEEALQRQIWYFNHAREYGEENIARLTTGISNWGELGQRYPKAKQALIEFRDRDEREFIEGRGYIELFSEIQNLNRELQDEESTVAIFKTIYRQNQKLAKSSYWYAVHVLYEKGEYELCLNCLGDPQASFEREREMFEGQKKFLPQNAELDKRFPTRGQMATNQFIGGVGRLIEILVATGHPKAAENIRDEALAVVEDPRLHSAISDATEQIRKKRVQNSEQVKNNSTAALLARNKVSPSTLPDRLSGRTQRNSASAETWSPTLAPDEKPDLAKMLEEIKTLMDQTHYEEALQRQIWYFNHAREYGDEKNVRLTSGISNWGELGQRYPKAKQALIEVRDRDEREFLTGRGYAALFSEIQSLNRELQDEESTVAIFKTVYRQNQKLARSSFWYAHNSLYEKGEYEICLNCMGDPMLRFGSLLNDLERTKASQLRMEELRKKSTVPSKGFPDPFYALDMGKMATNSFVTQTCQLVEILLGTGNLTLAESIRDQALKAVENPRLSSVIEDATSKIRSHRPKSGEAEN